jgi:hypothetical protein
VKNRCAAQNLSMLGFSRKLQSIFDFILLGIRVIRSTNSNIFICPWAVAYSLPDCFGMVDSRGNFSEQIVRPSTMKALPKIWLS